MIRVLFVRVEFNQIKQYKRMDLGFRPNLRDVIMWELDQDSTIPTRVYSIEIVTQHTIFDSNIDDVDIIAYTE